MMQLRPSGIVQLTRATSQMRLSRPDLPGAQFPRHPLAYARTSSSRGVQSKQELNHKTTRLRLERISRRLPRFLQAYTDPLLSAPIIHVTSFLILHELTAIVPIISLTTIFHYMNWLPTSLTEAEWMSVNVERFRKWARTKGWENSDSATDFGEMDTSARVVVEAATAYAITKVIMPLRLVVSVWAAPWFARSVLSPITAFLRR